MFASSHVLKDYIKEFAPEKKKRYVEYHSERFFKSYEILKSYSEQFDKEVVVDLGSGNGIFVPVINSVSSFKEIHIIDYGKQAAEDLKIQSSTETIPFKKHYLNLEADPLPFADNSVDVVIFFEILEHLMYDPMHVFLQINRILKENGFLFISTPNLNSAEAFYKMLQGNNPNLFTPYKQLEIIYERHNREFTIQEVKLLAEKSGFSIENIFTHPIKSTKRLNLLFIVIKLLRLSKIKYNELGTFMYLVCKKKRDCDLNFIDTDTRFPGPIYRYKIEQANQTK